MITLIFKLNFNSQVLKQGGSSISKDALYYQFRENVTAPQRSVGHQLQDQIYTYTCFIVAFTYIVCVYAWCGLTVCPACSKRALTSLTPRAMLGDGPV